MAKVKVNERVFEKHFAVSFVIVDNNHLNTNGVQYMASAGKEFILITSNRNHPAFKLNIQNMHIIFQETIDLSSAFNALYEEYHCQRLTLQSGGTINKVLLDLKLIDFVDIVVAPALIGGKNTSSLIDGDDNTTQDDINNIGVLKLIDARKLEDSYLRLKYKVIR